MEVETGFLEESSSTSGVETKKFLCIFCDFTNYDKGGMKRHIHAKHKTTGTKRGPDDSSNSFAPNDDDKRPKLDEDFDPSLASTQVMADDDEKDEFEELFLAEEIELNSTTVTLAGYSNETIARLADETDYDFENLNENPEKENLVRSKDNPPNSVIDAVLQADLAITSGRIKGLESAAKIKDLMLAEKEYELNNLRLENSELKNEMQKKDNVLEANIAKLSSVEDQLQTCRCKIILDFVLCTGTLRVY